ncbi:Ion transport protein [Popillia japonica]|uniref:Ion transport protein n=1 Tax=Popillia japonica TaxID=7064 RepID=A0AAW1LTW9_POPJA
MDKLTIVPANKMTETDHLLDEQNFAGYVNSKLIIEALESGSTLGDGSILGKFTINHIDPATLKLHFDSCIFAEVNKNEKEDTVVTFDYETILPKDPANNEIKTILKMTKAQSLHQLLTHPLISSFIYMKWRRMQWFFYFNLALAAIFWLSLAVHITLLDKTNCLGYVSTIVMTSCYTIIIIKEFSQVIILKKEYVFNISNWCEIILIILCTFVIFNPLPAYQKQFSAFNLLAVVLSLAILVKKHPVSSKYIIMLETVTQTFFYFLISYSMLLVAFSLSFYKLFDDKSNQSETTTSVLDGIFLSFFNVTLMLTGELNASSLKFETWVHGVVFVAFVLSVPIILFNLLCGLAVYDVNLIEHNAEIRGYIEVVKYIVSTEKYISFIASITPKLNFIEKMIFLYPYRLKYKKISVPLYDKNGKKTPIDEKTGKRLRRFLFHNNNNNVIADLQTIAANRTNIRQSVRNSSTSN